jgi:pSer/pThr/pTyr-binding forkhead associated (FHA) protein
MENSYKIILESGPNAGAEFFLEKDELFLGRDANNDVVINDPEVSRRHARLVKQDEDYYYEDLGSTNGSFINDHRLSTLTLLKPDMKITIGERVILSYQMKLADKDATVMVKRRVEEKAPIPPVVTPPPTPVVTPITQTPPPMVITTESGTPKKLSKTTMIILIVVGVILVFCVIPWIIMELTASYCNFFGGLFNLIQPGSC